MQTERFNSLRKRTLSNVFDKKRMIEIWRKIVRTQLRTLDLSDLYDHYDFNYNIEDRVGMIRNEVLSGLYKVSQPLIYRIEKKYGVCRHLVIPQPDDALVLQTIVEYINEQILSNQPSENAFYSRDRHNVSHPHEVPEYGFSRREQWIMMQKKIYHFHEEKNFIIVTDLANYFDSIDLDELRKVFTTYSKIDEVLIDLLFRIIQEISWKPDYLPYSKRGLPTTNIEGVRLLAHSFLFEVDDVVKQKTNNSFTRWMDDFVIGVDTRKEATEIISTISDMLKSRGLALNLAKTSIYDEEQAAYNFEIEANRYIDGIELSMKSEDNKKILIELNKKFKKHLVNNNSKYWDKVTKRYITAYSKLKSKSLFKVLPKLYIDCPSLRTNLLMYISNMGYSIKASNILIEIIDSINIFDDISLYQICDLVTKWKVPVNNSSKEFLNLFESKITAFSFRRKLPSDFYSILLFKAKYNHPDELFLFIKKYRNYWQSNTFLRRQVTAVMSRLLFNNSKEIEDLLYSQISSGVTNTVTLANQVLAFSKLDKTNSKMNFYLFPEKQNFYSLQKFLVLCSVLNSPKIRTNPNIQEKIKLKITDPYYLRWLDLQYNIS